MLSSAENGYARPAWAIGEGWRRDELLRGRGDPLTEVAGASVHHLVGGVARTHPSRAAVIGAGESVDYRRLLARADRIAADLAAVGAGPRTRVGVLCAPSPAMAAAALGVLRGGAAYLPLDRSQADHWIKEVLTDARAAAVVVTGEFEDRVAGLGLPVIRADRDADGAAQVGGAVPVTTSDPVYVIYTSGSTGEPKGVVVEHGQLAASTLARRRVYQGTPTFLLVSPLAFDSSAAGLWGTLTAGGTLVVATSDEVRDPERLVDLVRRHGVTHLLCLPSLYRRLLDAARRRGVAALRTLTSVTVAGEPLSDELVERHFAVLGRGVHLVNEYGPTEATVWASYHRFTAPEPVSIGGPVPGAHLYVLDDDLEPVPRGAEGELFIGGAGVARGYLGRGEATERAFLPDPFAGAPGARMYRSGDRVRWNDRGTLDFLGRRDQQVKIRGQRVEPGAVEAALDSLTGVREAVVVADEAGTRLVAFVVATAGFDPVAARQHLLDRLPAAMIPARVEVLEEIPRTFSGKADRPGLATLASRRTGSPAREAAPVADALTGEVLAAWHDVLKVPEVALDRNFFDLGGDSLAIFDLQDALERRTGARPSTVELYRNTTVAEQVVLIRDGEPGEPQEQEEPVRADGASRGTALRDRRTRIAGGGRG